MIDHMSSYGTDFGASRSCCATGLGSLGFEVQMPYAMRFRFFLGGVSRSDRFETSRR